MLRTAELNIAASLLPVVRTVGRGIVPIRGTLLGEVVRSAMPLTKCDTIDDVVINTVALTANDLNSPVPIQSPHSLHVEKLVEAVAPKIRAHVAFARGTGAALVTEAFEALSAKFATLSARPASEGFNVTPVSVPSVLSHGSMEDLINHCPEPDSSVPNDPLLLPMYSPEELVARLVQGGASFDKSIQEWVLTVPTDTLIQAWRSYFIGGSSGAVVGQAYMTNGDVIRNLEIACLVLLWSNHLLANTPADYRVMSLGNLERNLRNLSRQAAAVIRVQGRQASSMLKSGDFVLGYDRAAQTLRVVAGPYQDWLRSGGDVTVLLGMMVTGEVLYRTPAIDSAGARLRGEWRTYEAATIMNFENSKLDMLRSLAINWYVGSLSTLCQEEQDYLVRNPQHLNYVKDKGIQYLRTLKMVEFGDLPKVVLNLVAGIRLGFTAAYPILEGIHRVRQANSKLEVREAALVATMEYIADYLADQVTVE